MKFKTLKEFNEFMDEIKKEVNEDRFCPSIADHYFFDRKGKRIRRGKFEDAIIIEE